MLFLFVSALEKCGPYEVLEPTYNYQQTTMKSQISSGGQMMEGNWVKFIETVCEGKSASALKGFGEEASDFAVKKR